MIEEYMSIEDVSVEVTITLVGTLVISKIRVLQVTNLLR